VDIYFFLIFKKSIFSILKSIKVVKVLKYLLLIMKILILVIVLLLIFGCFYINSTENLCVNKSYGIVTDVPASAYINANMALVNTTSIGQAPLGDPGYWVPSSSPITQGQYGLYQPQNGDPTERAKLLEQALQMPVYT
jgi:hypothetical protein